MSALLLSVLLALPAPAVVVDDVTRINPVSVERVVKPRTVEEVIWLVKRRRGPISVAGGRFSMGGQTATEEALQLDMTGLDRVLALDAEKKLVTVEAGIRWRKLQEALDPHGLSVKIMQSYANFTVGGSLSVNVHGRYVNQGPLIRSVRMIRLVLPDGKLVEATPASNKELFYGAIGGYGGLGVIVAATLEVEPNEAVERSSARMPASVYKDWFFQNVRGSTVAVFHNANLLPPAFDEAYAITYARTSRPVTVKARLQDGGGFHLAGKLAAWAFSELPFGSGLRARIEPWSLRGRPVVWRNYEASYDVRELEPVSRRRSTYVLQEYFVPVAEYERFRSRMAEIFRRHKANVLNVSIRHAKPDPGSLLAWARGEEFAFVVYYKQATDDAEREAVAVWTRECIDAALASGGAYYLPYQIVATDAQFHKAYPRAKELFALKRRVDPAYKLRNKLWDRYLPPPAAKRLPPAGPREESQTFLTLPEWMIVFAADERGADPPRFAYFRAIRDFWGAYGAAIRAARGYPVNWGYHVMICVIGTSFTVEHLLIGSYEATAGRLFSLLPPAPEDAFVKDAVADYGRFIHTVPWYEYPYAAKLRELWGRPLSWSPRGLERRLAFGLELAVKAVYAKIIKKATGAAYAPEDLALLARMDGKAEPVKLDRYEAFTKKVRELAKKPGARFDEICGNRRILITVVAPASWDRAFLYGDVLGAWPVLSSPGKARFAVAVPVAELLDDARDLPKEGAELDHVFDY